MIDQIKNKTLNSSVTNAKKESQNTTKLRLLLKR